jgi:choline monooxygenase
MTDNYSFDSRIAHASTIPAEWYTSPEFYGLEQVRVFRATWQLAGRPSQARLPGQYFTLDIAGEPIVIVRGADNVLRALSNVCRHRAGPVASGSGNRSSFRCGYHGWTYGLDGKLAGCPEFDGVADFDRAGSGLPEFRAESQGGFVFVNIDSVPLPLETYLQGLIALPQCEPVVHREWDMHCNWKVYVDNYLEGYHIPVVHPVLNSELDYANYRTETYPFLSMQSTPLRPGKYSDKARFYWVFPNLMVNVYADNFSTDLIVPLGPERTRAIFEWYFFEPGVSSDRATVDQVVSISERIQLEDIAICESVQRGLRSSTYSSGRYSVRRECGVHHFHGLLSRFMEA